MSVFSEMANVPEGGTIDGIMKVLSTAIVLANKAKEDPKEPLKLICEGLVNLGVKVEDIKKTMDLSPVMGMAIQVAMMEKGMRDGDIGSGT